MNTIKNYSHSKTNLDKVPGPGPDGFIYKKYWYL